MKYGDFKEARNMLNIRTEKYICAMKVFEREIILLRKLHIQRD